MIPLMMALWVFCCFLSSHVECTSSVCRGAFSAYRRGAAAAAIQAANKQKEKRTAVIFNEIFCG